MNLMLTLESIKFYKVKHERQVQLGFVILYLVNLLPFLLPMSDPDFSRFMSWAEAVVSNPTLPMPALTTGNWIVIGLIAATSLLNLLCTMSYAALLVGEQNDRTGKSIAAGIVAGLPRLLLLFALMIVPILLSAILFMIPVFFMVSMLYLLPILLLAERRTLSTAITDSVKATRGFRLMILLQMFFMSVLLSLPESIILSLLPVSLITSVLVPQFFVVLQTFAQGRLMGLLYLYLVKKVPVMIPSKPQL